MPETQARTRIIKIVVLGDSGVGKTSLIRQYVTGNFSAAYKTTIGVDVSEKNTEIDGQPVSLQIWDTAGQERFHSVCNQFYRTADACVIVFDVTTKPTFNNIEDWLNDFISSCRKKETEEPEDVPVIIVGNKADLDPKHIEVPDGLVENWCEQHGKLKYFKVSAKTGDMVAGAFEHVAVESFKTSTAQFADNDEVFGDIVTRYEPVVADDEKRKCC